MTNPITFPVFFLSIPSRPPCPRYSSLVCCSHAWFPDSSASRHDTSAPLWREIWGKTHGLLAFCSQLILSQGERKIFISRVAVPHKPISRRWWRVLRAILCFTPIGGGNDDDEGLRRRQRGAFFLRPCNEVAPAANYSFWSFSSGPYHCSWTTLAKRQASQRRRV